MSDQPLITVLTPVYNGGRYLKEAVESVLSQSYQNWEYVIVNNRSTDDTLSVAERYAKTDSRIKVVTNETFVNCEANHNNAFRLVSAESRYCKVVSADDWLLPEALTRFVRFAVGHPTVGIVGSYQRSLGTIRWTGLPRETEVISGVEVCRRSLLDDLNVFGNPTSSLYRTDLVRKTPFFFPHDRPHADTSACYANLHDCDFGFIHEVLTVERVHAESVSSGAELMNAGDLAFLEMLLEYGPLYLAPPELETRRAEFEAIYYRTLARGLLRFKGRAYLRFHAAGMRSLGLELSYGRVARFVFERALQEAQHPFSALRKVWGALGFPKSGRSVSS